MKKIHRRHFISQSLQLGAAAMLSPYLLTSCQPPADTQKNEEPDTRQQQNEPGSPWFEISLAQYSLHRAIENKEIDNKDFPRIARESFDIGGVEWLNIYFKDKAKDQAYLKELNQISSDHGIQNILIMVDAEGNLGDTREPKRKQAVLNHFKWVEAAAALGCHSIRVNARGDGTADQVRETAADGLHKLGVFAKDYNINVIVENHGGFSSDGQWLSSVIRLADSPNVGTLPDFGNFCIKGRPQGVGVCEEPYDRYKGVKELMPFAKGVSAKSYTFDAEGNETTIDYEKMLSVVKEAGYTGFIGIEYEGHELSEMDGIRATQTLLQRFQSS